MTNNDDILSEANLWNLLWAYDLFPIAQSSWNRMPIVGADFATESSSNEPQPEPQSPSDAQSSDNSSSNSGTDDAEPNNSDAQEDSSNKPDPDISDPDNSKGSEPDNEQQDDNSSSSDNVDIDDDIDDESSDPNNELRSEDGNRSDDEEPKLDEDGNPIDDEEEDEEEDDGIGEDNEDQEEPEPGDLDSENPSSQDEHDDEGNIGNDDNLGDDAGSNGINEYHLEGPKPGTPLPIPGLTIIQTDAGTEYFREFNSWDEFVECVADESLYAWKNTRSSHNPKQRTAGAEASFAEAVEMARFRGWPEGRNLLSDLMANITTKNEPFEVWDLDVAGIFPIVPAFLSGDPACMIVDPINELRTQFPIIRIDYNHGVTWNILPQDMMIRGAAILSLANNLEARGFQTELRIVGNAITTHSHSKIETITFKYSIVYKKPGQFLDIDRAAFAIAHPACLRRLGFALFEQHADLEPSFSSNYGRPTYAPVDPESGTFGTIFVAGSKGKETEETARAAVMTAADATTSIIATAEAN